jgi:hypothetical protein
LSEIINDFYLRQTILPLIERIIDLYSMFDQETLQKPPEDYVVVRKIHKTVT